MKKLIISLTCFISSVATWAVENYPYRGDYLWVAVSNHADWIYKTGDQATVEENIRPRPSRPWADS